MQDVFFDGWGNLGAILISAPIVYLAVVAMIRISGKRSTAQMNNFDWLVTVAMGSLVGSSIVLETVTIAEVLLAIAALLALQYIATRLAFRSDTIAHVIKPAPRLVYDRGFLPDAMRDERVTRSEVRAAIRESGMSRLDDVRWVILETDGQFSVIGTSDADGKADVLEDVRRSDD
ncbi:DUF421 domain-containing protein [Maricaulis sp. CAU 1757]